MLSPDFHWRTGKSHLGDYYWTVFAHIAETPHTTHEGLLKKKKKHLYGFISYYLRFRKRDSKDKEGCKGL